MHVVIKAIIPDPILSPLRGQSQQTSKLQSTKFPFLTLSNHILLSQVLHLCTKADWNLSKLLRPNYSSVK